MRESCDDDGCTYRVELDSARGSMGLTSYYSSGYRSKEALAEQINAYIADPQKQTLELSTGSGFLGILIPVIFILAGPFVTFAKLMRG